MLITRLRNLFCLILFYLVSENLPLVLVILNFKVNPDTVIMSDVISLSILHYYFYTFILLLLCPFPLGVCLTAVPRSVNQSIIFIYLFHNIYNCTHIYLEIFITNLYTLFRKKYNRTHIYLHVFIILYTLFTKLLHVYYSSERLYIYILFMSFNINSLMYKFTIYLFSIAILFIPYDIMILISEDGLIISILLNDEYFFLLFQ